MLPPLASTTPAAVGIDSVLTSSAGARLQPQPPLHWGPRANATASNVLVINGSNPKQTIFGFGSALTESAAYNFASLSHATRHAIVSLLWAPPPAGNGYTVGRLTMGSADYSLSTYSLDDQPHDYNMSEFDDALTRDSRYVLPLARAARQAAGGDALRLFFSPWSPPAWLKINGDMIDTAHPEGLVQTAEAGAALARYFVRFAKALAAAGVPAWGATLQNEPLVEMKHHRYEACAWTAGSQAAWLREHLGPAVRADVATSHLKLLGYDWNKGELADWATTLRAEGGGYLDGVAFHWYQWKGGLKLSDLAATIDADPDTLALGTEASIIKMGIDDELADGASPPRHGHDGHGTLVGGGTPPGNGTVAYTYAAGELYLLDLLGDLCFGASGWVDWNAVLDYHGGPNHINRTDIGAPILVDAASDSYYVQSPYWYVGHVSRYAPPGAVRVPCGGAGFAATAADFDAIKDYIKPQVDGKPPPDGAVAELVACCFVSADGASAAVVVMNPNGGAPKQMTLAMGDHAAVASLPPHSVRTFTFDLARERGSEARLVEERPR